jgi:hypothetical protein
METNNNQQLANWLTHELARIAVEQPETVFDRRPALKIEENKLVELEIDFSKEWAKWEDQSNGVTKRIIPVKHEGAEKVFFLNTRNPLYKELLILGNSGVKSFKIMRTGQAKGTKYILVK